MEDWTRRLYEELTDDSDTDTFDEDKEKGIRILFEMLRGEYRQLILEKYKNQKSLRKLADEQHCTYQNVSSKINRTLKRMKESWCGGLIYGFDAFISQCPVEESALSKKAWLPLKRSGINTLEDVRSVGKDGIKKIRWMGAENIKEIETVLGWLFEESTSEKIRIALKERKWSDIKIDEFLMEIGL